MRVWRITVTFRWCSHPLDDELARFPRRQHRLELAPGRLPGARRAQHHPHGGGVRVHFPIDKAVFTLAPGMSLTVVGIHLPARRGRTRCWEQQQLARGIRRRRHIPHPLPDGHRPASAHQHRQAVERGVEFHPLPGLEELAGAVELVPAEPIVGQVDTMPRLALVDDARHQQLVAQQEVGVLAPRLIVAGESPSQRLDDRFISDVRAP